MTLPQRTTQKYAPSNRLALGASIAAVLLSGYGSRQAFANCTGSDGTYICSGTATTSQSMNSGANPLTVTTTTGFAIDTTDTGGRALTLESDRSIGLSLSFTDNNTSTITGATDGILSFNYGSSSTSITSTGTVTGTSGIGISVFNNYSTTDLTVTTAGVSGVNNGIKARNYGTGSTSITTSTGSVTATSGDGILAYNASTTIDLTIITADVSGGDTGIKATNNGTGTTSITVSGAVTGGKGGVGISNVTAAGTNSYITLNSGASVSATSGNAISDSLGNTTVTVNSGASVTGSVDLDTGTDEIILNGGTLNVATGHALTITGNLINSIGTINLQNSTVDAPATITGDFTGGGRLLLDADFAADTADTLTIQGNVLAGGTQVSINDVTPGASTATGNDITLISVNGTTATGDFALASSVVNGAFDYNTLTLVGNDWVLKSVALTGGSVYTPFASSFEAFGQSLLTLAALPSFADRTRNRMTGTNSGDDTGIDSPVWVRVAGGKRKIDSASSTTGADFDTNHWQAQIGADFTLSDTPARRFVAGVNAGYGRAKTDVNAIAGNSKLDTNSYSLGLSAAWFMTNGAYVDLQAQKSWYKTDLSAGGTGAGNVNDIDGDGYSASFEVGHVMALSDSLRITPQAQLIYAKVDTDTFTGANAEVVKLTDSKSIKARLGAELDKQFTEDGATHGFILANVIHEFEDETQVNVSGAQLVNSVDDWSGELGVGINHAWDQGTTHYELFATVTGGTSLNNMGSSNSVQGELGFKANF